MNLVSPMLAWFQLDRMVHRPDRGCSSARPTKPWFLPLGCLVAVLALPGCQTFSSSRLGVTDVPLATSGLARAAASGDPAACPSGDINDLSMRPPAELSKVALSAYRIEAPDVLLMGMITTTPKEPYYIKSLDILRVLVAGTLEDEPIAGDYQVQPGGMLNLGPSYGTVLVEGLTLAEADDAITRQLRAIIQPEVSVTLVQSSELQRIAGEKIVAPDGTVNLGIYGCVEVVGLTLQEARLAVEERLSTFFEDPKVSLDVFSYNSKSYYVILEGAGLGDQVISRPVVGNETVLDAIAAIQGIPEISSKRIWISRPSPNGRGCEQIIPVDWFAITRNANTSTNYQLLPGDRVFVAESRVLGLQTLVSRILDPVERLVGFSLLGAQTVQSIQRFPGGFFLNQGFF